MPPDFTRAKLAAVELLLEQRLYSLRVDVTKLRYRQAIFFDSMQNYCKITSTTLEGLSHGSDCLRDGCTFIRSRGGQLFYVVLFNEDAPHPRRRGFTLAHEVGHILLNHQCDGDVQEQEANHFAAQLLLPEVLVHAYAVANPGRLTPQALCQVFSASRQAAEYRIESLARNPHPRFFPQEQKLLNKLQHMISVAAEPEITI